MLETLRDILYSKKSSAAVWSDHLSDPIQARLINYAFPRMELKKIEAFLTKNKILYATTISHCEQTAWKSANRGTFLEMSLQGNSELGFNSSVSFQFGGHTCSKKPLLRCLLPPITFYFYS